MAKHDLALPSVEQGLVGRPVIRRFLFNQAFQMITMRFGGEPRAVRRRIARDLSKRNRTKLAPKELQNLYRKANGMEELRMELV